MAAATSETQSVVHVAVRRDRQRIRKAVSRIKLSERRQAVLEGGERRASDRSRVETVVYLTPVVVKGNHLEFCKLRRSMIAFTKDISVAGVGFTHDDPLETQHAIITFDLMDEGPLSLLVEIRWSRSASNLPYLSGYTSGCKFLAAVETPEGVCYSPP